ncbi:hypothetical protein AVEN_119749-1 [Araneus ventricosus]|uniref:Tc3 transposase DNA binding domain-containing protein n=1 Tax=Araneus ventricosus TaxID=182803 RepID=A0A4Y2FFF7_ARAVE|nr:hypothetical protein AVEN_119749-1 [Araneus ventricosus]
MSDKCIRSVPAAAMAGYQDLSDFERGVIIGAREMGHSISEVAMKFGFSRTIISRVYREYRTRILKRDRRATLPYIAADFNDGASTSVSVRTVQRTVINMGSQSRRPTRLPLLIDRSPPPRTPMDLWTVLKDEWCELPPRYLQTLIESLPHRDAAFLCVRGGATRY